MANHKKQFCLNGHDTFICGRNGNGQCIECRKSYIIEWQQKNKEKLKKKRHKYYLTHLNDIEEYNKTNKIKIVERRKGHYQINKQRILLANKKWMRDNKKRRQKYSKKYARIYVPKRLAFDPIFKLSMYLRHRLYMAIKNNAKLGSAVKDLGCSITYLKDFIEAQFYDNMTWDNWGKVWELDHIKELHTFDLTNRKQFLEANHYTNLQPLTIEDHNKKSAQNRRR